MSLKDVDRKEIVVGRWVEGFHYRASEPSYGRIVKTDLEAGTITILWLYSAKEERHNIVPNEDGDVHTTHTLRLSTREAVDAYIARHKAAHQKNIARLKEELQRAEDAQAYFTEAVHLVLGGL